MPFRDPALLSEMNAPGDQPGFYIGPYASPKYADYVEKEMERRKELHMHESGLAADTAISNIDTMASSITTREQLAIAKSLKDRAVTFREYMQSGNPKLVQTGINEMSKLYDDIDRLGTALDKSGAEGRAAAQMRGDAVFTESVGLREDMHKELAPIQIALDSFKAIERVSNIESPFALTAAAYKTVMLLQQGTGSRISDADLNAAQKGITSWGGWLEQQIAAGASGEGFTADARNKLLATLSPLAQIASDQASQIVARGQGIVEADPGRYDPETVFAGFDERLYRKPLYTPSPIPTAEEQIALDAKREAAIAEGGEQVGETVGQTVRGFFDGYLGLSKRDEILNEDRIQLTPGAQQRLDSDKKPIKTRVQRDPVTKELTAIFPDGSRRKVTEEEAELIRQENRTK